MEIMKLMDLMNYNFENKERSLLYDVYSKFIEANIDILTTEQLQEANNNLISPKAFDDGKTRSEQEYQNTINKITMYINNKMNYENGRGMIA